ncbi:hypothetical protein J3A65_004556 [Rhizobium sp. PvP014]|nr:hypothetical protein [Rhizobium sp. PvP014]MBP2531955.1 hypothetical protein [Rhizobium sp. PvP099]
MAHEQDGSDGSPTEYETTHSNSRRTGRGRSRWAMVALAVFLVSVVGWALLDSGEGSGSAPSSPVGNENINPVPLAKP